MPKPTATGRISSAENRKSSVAMLEVSMRGVDLRSNVERSGAAMAGRQAAPLLPAKCTAYDPPGPGALASGYAVAKSRCHL